MILILISLICGILIGIFNLLPAKVLKINNIVQKVGVILLIFTMGISVGYDSSLVFQLKTLGLKALTFAVLTVVLSSLLLYILSFYYYKKKKENEN